MSMAIKDKQVEEALDNEFDGVDDFLMVQEILGLRAEIRQLKGEEPINPLGELPEEKIIPKEAPEVKLTEDEKKGAAGLGVSEEKFKEFITEGGGEDLPPSRGSGTPL